jgi:hypothetical protein
LELVASSHTAGITLRLPAGATRDKQLFAINSDSRAEVMHVILGQARKERRGWGVSMLNDEEV